MNQQQYPEEDHPVLKYISFWAIVYSIVELILGFKIVSSEKTGIWLILIGFVVFGITLHILIRSKLFRHWDHGSPIYLHLLAIIPFFFGSLVAIGLFLLIPFMKWINRFGEEIVNSFRR
jgi:hypothetical protein